SSLETEDMVQLLAVIGDEVGVFYINEIKVQVNVLKDTCVGFMLAGIGQVDENRQANFMVVDKRTTPVQIEACFKNFLARPEIGIILINQEHADVIRPTVDAHLLAVPTVIEIPSKQNPYDVSKDSILKRA
ncbi:hypothetical protein KR200_008674, partial [Drosophila serrata]